MLKLLLRRLLGCTKLTWGSAKKYDCSVLEASLLAAWLLLIATCQVTDPAARPSEPSEDLSDSTAGSWGSGIEAGVGVSQGLTVTNGGDRSLLLRAASDAVAGLHACADVKTEPLRERQVP